MVKKEKKVKGKKGKGIASVSVVFSATQFAGASAAAPKTPPSGPGTPPKPPTGSSGQIKPRRVLAFDHIDQQRKEALEAKPASNSDGFGASRTGISSPAVSIPSPGKRRQSKGTPNPSQTTKAAAGYTLGALSASEVATLKASGDKPVVRMHLVAAHNL